MSESSRTDVQADGRPNVASASTSDSCGGARSSLHSLHKKKLSECTNREHGAGELYAYVPLNDENTAALTAVPNSHRNPDYGFSVGRGLWTFVPGKWTAVAERVKMNTVGHADGMLSQHVTPVEHHSLFYPGEIEVYIDGQSVILAKGLVLRDTEAPESSVQGLHVQTFFGGTSGCLFWRCACLELSS